MSNNPDCKTLPELNDTANKQIWTTRALKKNAILRSILFAALLYPASNLYAQLDDKFSLSLGGFVTSRDTQTRLDSSNTVGLNTDFEEALGLDDSDSVFRLDGYYRFNERHRLDFSVFDLSRSASNRVQGDLQWGDTQFGVDTVVDTEFDLDIYKLAYTYTFNKTDKGYLGVTAGLYVADTRVELTGQGQAGLQGDVGDITAPLPVVGLRLEQALSENWTLRGSAEFFALETNNVDGSLSDLYVGLDYQAWDNVALGIGYNDVGLDVDADRESFDGALDWQYSGALVFIKFDF